MLDLTALKTEIETDPAGLGYAVHLAGGATGTIADLLNAVRAGITVNRGKIPRSEVIAVIDWTEATAGTVPTLAAILTDETVDVSNAFVRKAFGAAFLATTTTRDRLVALVTRPGSRADQLFGQLVSHLDVARALREG